jgi:small subunit ribosomal protein S18
MGRNNAANSSNKRSSPKIDPRKLKKKACQMCKDGVVWVDYKDVAGLRRQMSDRGKIRGQRVSGNCAQHQNDIATAIKTARELALLPFTQQTVTEKPGRRGDRGGRGRRSEERDGDQGNNESAAAPSEDAVEEISPELAEEITAEVTASIAQAATEVPEPAAEEASSTEEEN